MERYKKPTFVLFVLTSFFTSAQSGLGSWNIVTINGKIDSKWNVFTEYQIRSLAFYDDFHYFEIKGGATYKINSNFSVTTGIGTYNTYREGGNFTTPAENLETRTWLQVNMKNPLKYFTFEHRYRVEQRFTSNGYRNRFRYRLGALIPVNNQVVQPKTFYISVWNEIFFTNNEPYFERNRSFVGFGYEFSNNLALQTGYIHQFDYKINDETGRDFFNIALLYNFNFSKKTKDGFEPTTYN